MAKRICPTSRSDALAESGTHQDKDDGMNETQQRALTEHEVAQRLSLSVATLRAWRLKRKGPRYVRFGRAVRYLEVDVDRYVDTCGVDAAREQRPASD